MGSKTDASSLEYWHNGNMKTRITPVVVFQGLLFVFSTILGVAEALGYSLSIDPSSKYGDNDQGSKFLVHVRELYQCYYDTLSKGYGLNDRLIVAVSLAGIHIVSFGGHSLFFALADTMGFLNRWRIRRIEEYPPKALIVKAVVSAVVEAVIIFPVLAYYAYDILFHRLKVSPADFPTSWSTWILHLSFAFACNETLFYVAHRALHHRSIYKYIHKQHHEFRDTIGVAAEYAHPVEGVVANLIPTLFGLLVLRSHLSLMVFWLYLRIEETVESHSGYQLPWSLWSCFDYAEKHDYHHSHNIGNYGAPFWDFVMGTDQYYRKWKTRKEAGRVNKKKDS